MHASTPMLLSPDDKLDLLRNLDEFHFWHSLDDRRFCNRCGRSITGRQILAFELKGTRGHIRLQCPTVGCVSNPGEWIYADPVLAARLKSDSGADAGRFKRSGTDVPFAYQGRVCTVRPEKQNGEGIGGAKRRYRQWAVRPKISFREAAARLPILRSIVTGFHAFHPVA